jgi:hypothetical protein
LSPLLDDAMAKLRDKDRAAVVLRYFQNKSLREVGEVLGIEERAAQKRVARALEKLRVFFAGHGVRVSAGGLSDAIAANSLVAVPPGLTAAASAAGLKTAAAGGSVAVAFANGATRLMAWARAKTAAAITAAVLAATGAGILADVALHAAPAAGGPDIQGAWEGVVQGPRNGIWGSGKTRLVFKILRTNGVYSASLDAIDMAMQGVKVTGLIYKYPHVRLDLGESAARTELTVDREGTTMTGTLGPKLWDEPVVLKKTDTPDAIPEPLPESAYAPRRGSDLQGYWTGSVRGLHVAWKIAELPDGTFRSELDTPDQGLWPQPASITYNRPAVTMGTLLGNEVLFDGNLDGDGAKLSGVWHAGNWRIPVAFTRAEPPGEKARAQVEDFAYFRDTDLQSHWKGTVEVDGNKVPVGFDIARLADGSFSASIVCADFGMTRGAPANVVRYTAPKVFIQWKTLGAAFEGSLKSGKLTGQMRQGPATFPVVLERHKNE